MRLGKNGEQVAFYECDSSMIMHLISGDCYSANPCPRREATAAEEEAEGPQYSLLRNAYKNTKGGVEDLAQW